MKQRKEFVMAQDFGDDVGERLFRSIGRAAGYVIRDWLRERGYEQRIEERKAAEEAAKQEEAQPDEICLPFGEQDDAATFAKVCQQNGVEVDALADADGNGYVRFATEDLERVQECSRDFANVMAQLRADQIAEQLENVKPLTQEQIDALTEVKDLPDLPKRDSEARDAPVQEDPAANEPVRDEEQVDEEPDLSSREQPSLVEEATVAHAASVEVNLTERIADRVREARAACRTYDDFCEILAHKGIGVTTTKDGENMFYEARRDDDGRLLPFGRDEQGKRDWAVGAKTLWARYNVDATHDWFERNTPKSPRSRREEMVMTPEGPMSGSAAEKRWDEIAKDIGTQKPADVLRRWHELGRQAQEPLRVGPQREYEPQVTDGSLDTDGRTPDLNQGIDSHDGMDTDTRTLRIEREQTGTDVAPSEVREEAEQSLEASHDDGRGYSLSSEAQDARAASRQLEVESGHTEHDLDISDKMSQVR